MVGIELLLDLNVGIFVLIVIYIDKKMKDFLLIFLWINYYKYLCISMYEIYCLWFFFLFIVLYFCVKLKKLFYEEYFDYINVNFIMVNLNFVVYYV